MKPENYETIPPGQVSVVIQGPLRFGDGTPGIEVCIASIREHLPGCEIIVSTWEGQDTSSLGDCIIVRSLEPPSIPPPPGGRTSNVTRPSNVNRQIVSTVAGLRLATRPYALKIRADLSLSGRQMLRLRKHGGNAVGRPRLVSSPITATSLFVRNPRRAPFLFHIPDLTQFGRTPDMLDLWDLPLATANDLAMDPGAVGLIRRLIPRPPGFRLCPEQWITLSWMGRHGLEASLPSMRYISCSLLRQWDALIFENFDIIDWMDAGVVFPERLCSRRSQVSTVYRASEINALRAMQETAPFLWPLVLGARVAMGKVIGNGRDFLLDLLYRLSPAAFYRLRYIATGNRAQPQG